MCYLTNKEAKTMYYTVIKHDGNLRTLEKFRKHEPQAHKSASKHKSIYIYIFHKSIFIGDCLIIIIWKVGLGDLKFWRDNKPKWASWTYLQMRGKRHRNSYLNTSEFSSPLATISFISALHDKIQNRSFNRNIGIYVLWKIQRTIRVLNHQWK